MTTALERVDHLVYATPNLDDGIAQLERLLGVRATPGGRHPGRGTRNALIALGPRSYLEILGPDPEQSAGEFTYWLGMEGLSVARLVAWAANTTNIDQLAVIASQNGVGLGAVAPGRRLRSDGLELRWRFTDPTTVTEDGIVPFFIDWGSSPHPAASAPSGATLVSFSAEHPHRERVQASLRLLNLEFDVRYGPTPTLIATIKTAKDEVTLR